MIVVDRPGQIVDIAIGVDLDDIGWRGRVGCLAVLRRWGREELGRVDEICCKGRTVGRGVVARVGPVRHDVRVGGRVGDKDHLCAGLETCISAAVNSHGKDVAKTGGQGTHIVVLVWDTDGLACGIGESRSAADGRVLLGLWLKVCVCQWSAWPSPLDRVQKSSQWMTKTLAEPAAVPDTPKKSIQSSVPAMLLRMILNERWGKYTLMWLLAWAIVVRESPLVWKLGSVTVSHATPLPLADLVTVLMSNWYMPAPEPEGSVKMTFVSWSSTDPDRPPKLDGGEVVDWVDHESPAKSYM